MSTEIRDFSIYAQRTMIKNIKEMNNGHTYIFGPNYILCMVCLKVSHTPGDMNYRFCLQCGYHEDIERDLYVPKKNPYAG